MIELIVGLFIGLIVAVLILMGLSVFVAYITQAEYIDDREYDLHDD
jgi:hypothetical protein